jgi:hypothetical protein
LSVSAWKALRSTWPTIFSLLAGALCDVASTTSWLLTSVNPSGVLANDRIEQTLYGRVATTVVAGEAGVLAEFTMVEREARRCWCDNNDDDDEDDADEGGRLVSRCDEEKC